MASASLKLFWIRLTESPDSLCRINRMVYSHLLKPSQWCHGKKGIHTILFLPSQSVECKASKHNATVLGGLSGVIAR